MNETHKRREEKKGKKNQQSRSKRPSIFTPIMHMTQSERHSILSGLNPVENSFSLHFLFPHVHHPCKRRRHPIFPLDTIPRQKQVNGKQKNKVGKQIKENQTKSVPKQRHNLLQIMLRKKKRSFNTEIFVRDK